MDTCRLVSATSSLFSRRSYLDDVVYNASHVGAASNVQLDAVSRGHETNVIRAALALLA